MMMRISTSNGFCALALVLLTVGAVTACGGDDDGAASAAGGGGAGGSGGGKLTLVAYSTPKEAYEAVIAGFQASGSGRDVDFDQSYGASGDQSRAVATGLPADVVAFSLEPDMARLTDQGLVEASWNQGPTGGMVTGSVVVFVVRKGNPEDIRPGTT
jgi:sulfate/thiosulfate transport system substrate-binding protein